MGRNNWREIGVGLIVPVIILGVWQTVAVAGLVNPQMLPSPLAVAQKWLA